MSRVFTRVLLVATLLVAIGILILATKFSRPSSEGGWAAVGGALAVIAAVFAAWTGQKAIELQEDAQSPFPYPSIDAESRYGLLQLRVKNSGGTHARDIRLFWDKPLVNSKGDSIRFTTQEGAPDIPVLQPGESASVLIDGAVQFFPAVQDASYSGRVQFADSSGRVRQHSFFLSAETHRRRLTYDREELKTHYQLQQIPTKLDALIDELSALRAVFTRTDEGESA